MNKTHSNIYYCLLDVDRYLIQAFDKKRPEREAAILIIYNPGTRFPWMKNGEATDLSENM